MNSYLNILHIRVIWTEIQPKNLSLSSYKYLSLQIKIHSYEYAECIHFTLSAHWSHITSKTQSRWHVKLIFIRRWHSGKLLSNQSHMYCTIQHLKRWLTSSILFTLPHLQENTTHIFKTDSIGNTQFTSHNINQHTICILSLSPRIKANFL